MRDELNAVLKDYLQMRLQRIKCERNFTQADMADILQMDRRTFAAIIRGEHSLGGLSLALYFTFLADDSGAEMIELRRLFLLAMQDSTDSNLFRSNAHAS